MLRTRTIGIVAVLLAIATCVAAAIAIAQPAAIAVAGKASTQVTLAPAWGSYKALAGVTLVENINVRIYQPDGTPRVTVAQARDEYRKGFAAYKAAGAEVGFYIGGELLEGIDPYYPPVGLTPDPRWLWGSVRVARKGGLPMVAAFELGGLRWTIDRAHAPTLSRVALRAKTLLRERIADAGVAPDFIFFDNCGLRVNGGVDDLDTFVSYTEMVTDSSRWSVLINCSATPNDWKPHEWDAVAFAAEMLRSDGRWLGFAFETALRPVQLGSGPAAEAELSAFRRLLDAQCRVVWDVGLQIPDGGPAAQTRLAAVAETVRRPGDALLVGCDFFRAAPAWAAP